MLKRTKPGNKVMSYIIQPEVMEALEDIMKEQGYKTMSKAITVSVLSHRHLHQRLKEEESAAAKLFHEKMAIESQLTKFVQFLDYVKKHTKTS
jgi:hypothetical protein